MPDEPAHLPDWLAALHCPICGDVKLSHAWRVPDHIPKIVEGFGPRHPPARRWIVIKFDTMADNYWNARQHEAVTGLKELKARFGSTAKAAKNLRNKLRDLQVRQAILLANVKHNRIKPSIRRGVIDYDADDSTPLDDVDHVLRFVEDGALDVMREPDIYYHLLGRRMADVRKKHLERTHLWEPVLKLLHDFNIEEFDRYQELTKTVGALHLALGIDPPDKNLLKQVAFLWRKQRLSEAP